MKGEEVIFGPSDHLPQCFCKYMGLCTSLQQENWHYGPAFKKRLIPVSICHLMLNSTLYILIFSHDSDPMVSHILDTVCIALLNSIVENLCLVNTGDHDRSW